MPGQVGLRSTAGLTPTPIDNAGAQLVFNEPGNIDLEYTVQAGDTHIQLGIPVPAAGGNAGILIQVGVRNLSDDYALIAFHEFTLTSSAAEHLDSVIPLVGVATGDELAITIGGMSGTATLYRVAATGDNGGMAASSTRAQPLSTPFVWSSNHTSRIAAFALVTAGEVDAPTVESIETNAAGTKITVHFSEPMTPGTGSNAGWTADFSGGASTLTYDSSSGTAGTADVVYNSSRTIGYGEVLAASYAPAGAGINGASGALAAFSDFPITNNVPSPVNLGWRMILRNTDTGELLANATNLVWNFRQAPNDEATLLKGTAGTTNSSGVFTVDSDAIGTLGATRRCQVESADGSVKTPSISGVVVDLSTADLSAD